MIQGIHGMFYTSEPEALRAFLRDKLQLPCKDVGEGWLIFDFKEADMGCHPTDGSPPSGTHYVSFYTDDIETTVTEMRERSVEFTDEVTDRGYAVAIHFTMPGGIEVELYQPRYK